MKAIHKNKDNCDRKSAEKNVELYERQNCPKSDLYGSTQVGSPYKSGLESDMYTVQARSKICPCVPPRTRACSPSENGFT